MTLPFKATAVALSFTTTIISLQAQELDFSKNDKKIEAKSIFNGKDLTGWKVVGGNGQFKVEDGCIVGFGKNIKGNTFLRTEKTYRDFVFSYEFKFDDRTGNSGLMFRAQQKPTNDGNGRVFGYQCEGDNTNRSWTAGIYDEARRGWLFPKKAKGEPAHYMRANFTAQGNRLFKWDGWNNITIRCQGNRIQTWLNGELRADFIDTDKKHDTREGFFGLQVHGGKSCNVRWKNLMLKELVSQTPTQTIADNNKGEWTNLLGNGSLEQWTGMQKKELPTSWKLENGILHFNKANGTRGSIITKKNYLNFECIFEWKISQAGNSGVKYRTNKGLGPEYQVLDDKKHRDNKKPTHRAASLYEIIAAPDDKPLKPVGEWNSSKIVASGNTLEHWLNGKMVTTIEISSESWNKAFKASKYKKLKEFGSTSGPILLQDHDDEVWYRNLKIRSLAPAK